MAITPPQPLTVRSKKNSKPATRSFWSDDTAPDPIGTITYDPFGPDLKQPEAMRSFNSYSGTDIRALVAMPAADGQEPIYKTLANLQTISYSIFREKMPVRALGNVGEKGRTRGPRTIAGSMVFTVFDRHVLFDFMRKTPGDRAVSASTPLQTADMSYVMVDQLPPFDVVIQFANEYGFISEMAIFGIEISAEGQVMSIEDLITENTVQYTASHISIMRPGGYQEITKEIVAGAGYIPTFESIMNSGSAAIRELAAKTRNIFR